MIRRLLFSALITLPALSAALVFKGPGVNTHGMLLPINELRSIGVKWVRAEVIPRDFNRESVVKILDHYRGMPVLWILPQSQPASDARVLESWGVTDIEVGNEPEQAVFSPTGVPWTPEQYAKWFVDVKRSATKARLYGPATGQWLPDFVARAKAAGMTPTAVTWHGYWKTIPQVKSVFDECQAKFGLPSICSEVGFGTSLKTRWGRGYPAIGTPSESFAIARSTMKDLAWCWYDGPNANDDKTMGLFDWNGSSWSIPTATYKNIKTRLGL